MNSFGTTLAPVLRQLKATLEQRGYAEDAADDRRDLAGEILATQLNSVFGRRYIDCTLDNYQVYDTKQEAVLQTCRTFLASHQDVMARGRGLIFSGASGTGKDHLVSAICRELIRRGTAVKAVKFYELVDVATESQNQHGTWRKALEPYIKAPFLVLSEIGIQKEGGTDFERKLLYHLIDERYKNLKPYILTTNLDWKQLQATVDPAGTARVWDRLAETGKVVLCNWESYRRRKTA